MATCQQKAWDAPSVQETYQAVLANSADPRSCARLFAAATKESGAWLNALPISTVGLSMDDEVVRVAVGLRLGAALCQPHSCQRCGAQVDLTGTYGLSCSRSEGRHPHHAALNDVIQRSLAAAHIPSTLEPIGQCRTDGKWPDGLTIVLWKCGRSLIWDVTCPDKFAPSHIPQATRQAGAVASAAEVTNSSKYQDLLATHVFFTIAVETLGAFGPEAEVFIREVGPHLQGTLGDPMSHAHLLQRLMVTVQRGNAAAVLGQLPLIDD